MGYFSSYIPTVRTLFEDFDAELSKYLVDANIDEVWLSHDNWNGGIDTYNIVLTVPTDLFKSLRRRNVIEQAEAELDKCYADAMRGEGESLQIASVVIRPTTADVSQLGNNYNDRMWKPGYFRLFISHLSECKESASNLKECLQNFGIDGFVAHEDITPSKEWEQEIEAALFSLDALCAIVVPGFEKSNWCDQEVGIALGRKKMVFSIKKGKDPYGFFGKYQALPSQRNANQFLNLSSVGCQLRPIMINDTVLIQSQFVKGVTKYLLNLNPPEEVYQKTYKSGWSIDVLFDGQNYYYLEPASLQPQGFIKRQITTIEQLQSEILVRERKEITLPLLNTVLNKQKLKDALTAQLTRRYICFVGGSNGIFVDNDPNRPDYQYLKMDPIDPNSDPAVIELNNFRAQGCTIAFIIQQDVIQYPYGMAFQDVVASHPHLANLFAQYTQYLQDLYYSVNNAVEDALTC